MALKATIFKANLQLADMDRGVYADHAVTLARHPSETDERMMVRLLAFALNADDALEFGRGLSSEGEPDLVKKDLIGAIDLGIDVGLPDEREIRKAASRARQVKVYVYGGRSAALWWTQNHQALERLDNVAVFEIAPEHAAAITAFAARSMQIDCTIQEGQVWIASNGTTVHLEMPSLSQE